MYVAVIFDPSEEGIEGKLMLGADEEILKHNVAVVVDSDNDDEHDFSWHGTTYYPEGDPKYGSFVWAKIYDAYEYSTVSFSEF